MRSYQSRPDGGDPEPLVQPFHPRLPFPRLAGSHVLSCRAINCTLRPPCRSSAQSFLAVPRLPPASPDAGIGTPGRGRTWHRWAKPPFLHFHGESTPSFGISLSPSRLRGRGTEGVAVSHFVNCPASTKNQPAHRDVLSLVRQHLSAVPLSTNFACLSLQARPLH